MESFLAEANRKGKDSQTEIREEKEDVKHEFTYLRYIKDSGSAPQSVVAECLICHREVTIKRTFINNKSQLSCGCHRKLRPRQDFTGEYINGIQLIGYISNSMWRCLMACGHIRDMMLRAIKKASHGHCRNCSLELGLNNKKHGLAGTRVYKIHFGMKDRCRNPESDAYMHYGGRGIYYDPRWESFEVFWEDMSEGYSDHLELDRIDPNGNYCKENCRWAGRSLQCYNRRLDTNNTSGKSGVSFSTSTGKWHAYIDFEGRRINLKLHETFEEAVRVRELAEIEYFGFNKE